MGWVGVVSLGYGFGNGLRAEIEGNYRENDVDSINGFGGTTVPSGTARSYGVMANAFYDFDLGQGANFGGFSLLPYVGVGAGYIWREFDDVRASVLGGRSAPTAPTAASPTRLIVGACRAADAVGAGPGLHRGIPLPRHAGAGHRHQLRRRFLHRRRGGTKCGELQPLDPDRPALRLRPAAPPPPAMAPSRAPAAAPAPARTYLVFFDWDRADLTDRARQIIGEAAQNSTRARLTRIEVAGHADRSGTPQYNQRLSQRRADAVAAELRAQGVPRSDDHRPGLRREPPAGRRRPTACGSRRTGAWRSSCADRSEGGFGPPRFATDEAGRHRAAGLFSMAGRAPSGPEAQAPFPLRA